MSVTLLPNGLDNIIIEPGLNARQALSILASALAGVNIATSTTTPGFQAANNPNTERIIGIVDGKGNRNSVTLFPPA